MGHLIWTTVWLGSSDRAVLLAQRALTVMEGVGHVMHASKSSSGFASEKLCLLDAIIPDVISCKTPSCRHPLPRRTGIGFSRVEESVSAEANCELETMASTAA